MESICQILAFVFDDSLPLPTPPLLFFLFRLLTNFLKNTEKIPKHDLFCIIWD